MRIIGLAALLVLGGGHTVLAQDLVLPAEAAEAGFRQIIRMAQTGQLGADVVNANVEVSSASLRVELVRADGERAVLLLSSKNSPQTESRYFDITRGPGASAEDVTRLGRALDAAFASDPFRFTDVEQSTGVSEDIPGWLNVWRTAGWRGVRLSVERRMMAHASRTYTLIVTALVAIALGAGCLTLWLSLPPPRR